jgi:hypothetical protein
MYLIRWFDPRVFPTAYWICYLVSILAEFMVLVEISDHIFQSFPAIRNLGRAITVVMSTGLGLFYMLPVVLWAHHSRPALLGFALRASVTKAIILAVLFYAARYYGSVLGRNVGGLMLGFSIYLAVNIATMAAAMAFGPRLFGPVMWSVGPLAFVLCASVWTISLWELDPMPRMHTVSAAPGRDSEDVAVELIRFNGELSKLLHK